MIKEKPCKNRIYFKMSRAINPQTILRWLDTVSSTTVTLTMTLHAYEGKAEHLKPYVYTLYPDKRLSPKKVKGKHHPQKSAYFFHDHHEVIKQRLKSIVEDCQAFKELVLIYQNYRRSMLNGEVVDMRRVAYSLLSNSRALLGLIPPEGEKSLYHNSSRLCQFHRDFLDDVRASIRTVREVAINIELSLPQIH